MADNSGVVMVAIVETNVFGAIAYHARCMACQWESKRKYREEQALADAKRHQCALRKES